MAITRTPIHDDDGSGTTGTIIDNAWKQEFYDQIDAADAAGAPISLLTKTNGSSTGSGANLVTFTMPALTQDDSIRVVVSMTQAGAAGTNLYLSTPGIVFIRLDDIGSGRAMNAGEFGLWEVVIHECQTNPAQLQMNAWGGVGGQPGGTHVCQYRRRPRT